MVQTVSYTSPTLFTQYLMHSHATKTMCAVCCVDYTHCFEYHSTRYIYASQCNILTCMLPCGCHSLKHVSTHVGV